MKNLFIVLSFLCLNTVIASEFSDAMKKAISSRKAKNYPAAISSYSTALKHCKNDSQKLSCLFNLANCYFFNQQYEEAIPYLDQILALEETQDQPNEARINSTLNFKINSYKKLAQFQPAMDTLNILIQRESVSEGMRKSAKKTMLHISEKENITLPENFEEDAPATKQVAPVKENQMNEPETQESNEAIKPQKLDTKLEQKTIEI